VAVAVKVNNEFFTTVLLLIEANTGVSLIGVTVILTVAGSEERHPRLAVKVNWSLPP
jgi:hypothetical protein